MTAIRRKGFRPVFSMLLSVLLCIAWGASSSVALAQSGTPDKASTLVRSGKAKAQLCTRCHGRNGLRQAAARSGLDENVGAFVTREIIAFRAGQRLHPIMTSIAETLSDTDLAAISAWLDSIKP